jgi:hypothetical protein
MIYLILVFGQLGVGCVFLVVLSKLLNNQRDLLNRVQAKDLTEYKFVTDDTPIESPRYKVYADPSGLIRQYERIED